MAPSIERLQLVDDGRLRNLLALRAGIDASSPSSKPISSKSTVFMMTDSEASPVEANPYTADSGAKKRGESGGPPETTATDSPITIRLLPALIIVGLMWFLIIVPGKFFPLTMIHFMSMQLGPPVCGIALAVWWLASRRVPLRQRILGLVVVIATLIGIMFTEHSSMVIVMLIDGNSTALTILIAGFAATRSQPWARRIRIAYAGYAIFLIGTLLFRVGQIDAAFAFTLVPRWAPTAEDTFLAELEQAGESEPVKAEVTSLPDEAASTDWAEFRGPERNGVLRNVKISSDWENSPPQELWRKPVGPGWSAFCVVDPMAFTQEQRGGDESVVAYRVDDGSQVWVSSRPARFEGSMGGVGPRATPTYHSGKLFVTGATGVVQSLDASTGEVNWSYDLVKQLEIGLPAWGFSSSPLVVDDLVIVFAGGGESKAVVALDLETGELRWSSSDGYHAYGSPQLSIIDGQRQVLISSNLGVRGLDVADGHVLFKYDWDIGQMARVTQPLVVGNAIYLGTGYGNGTRRIDASYESGNWHVVDSWTAPLKPYFNDFVHYQGHLYGFDDSVFTSVDAETGERNWKRGRYGFGQVLLIESMAQLLVLSEKGKLVLMSADPARHKELASLQVLQGVTWNHPVIAGGKLFVRNAEEAACYSLPGYETVSAAAPDG